MVIDAEGTPVYATHLDKQKAVSEFVANWKKHAQIMNCKFLRVRDDVRFED